MGWLECRQTNQVSVELQRNCQPSFCRLKVNLEVKSLVVLVSARWLHGRPLGLIIRFACICSSGLEALSCLFSTKFFRCTDLLFTTSSVIAHTRCQRFVVFPSSLNILFSQLSKYKYLLLHYSNPDFFHHTLQNQIQTFVLCQSSIFLSKYQLYNLS